MRVRDVNGPRGGVTGVRINVALIGLAPVVVEGRDATLESAIDSASPAPSGRCGAACSESA